MGEAGRDKTDEEVKKKKRNKRVGHGWLERAKFFAENGEVKNNKRRDLYYDRKIQK